MTGFVEWSALGNILVFGLVLGAGVPVVYALGVRAMYGPGAFDNEGHTKTLRKLVGLGCFALCGLVAIGGIAFIAFGGR